MTIRPKTSPYIYFMRPIGMSGPVKIGCSIKPPGRLMTFAVWSPFPLQIVATIPGSFTLEKNIHECLAFSHSHREWFRPTPDVVALVEGLIAGGQLTDLIDLSKRQGRIKDAEDTTPERAFYFDMKRRVRAAKREWQSLNPGWIISLSDDRHRQIYWWSRDMGSPHQGLVAYLEEFISNPLSVERPAARKGNRNAAFLSREAVA